LIFDILVLFFSAWLSAIVFAGEVVISYLNPTDIDNSIFVGMVSVSIFVISLIQMKTDWKQKSEAHKEAVKSYSQIKLQLAALLSQQVITNADYEASREKYMSIGSFSTPIPDAQFLRLKKKHKLKVELSKLLGQFPGASLFLLRLKIWWRDNFQCNRT